MKHENNKYRTISDLCNYMNKLTTQEVEKMEAQGTKLTRAKTVWLMIYSPIKYFFGLLFYKGAIRAGWAGVWNSEIAAQYEFWKYLKYYEKYYVENEKRGSSEI